MLTLLPALVLTLAVVAFTTLIAVAFFKHLDPPDVVADYAPCLEHWHEAVRNGCEQGLLQVPQQPINTYTNMAYLAGGVATAALVGTPPSWAFAFAMGYLCAGSMLFHAVSTHWGQMLDITGIYAVFSALATYAAVELLRSLWGPAAGGAETGWIVAAVMLGVSGVLAYVLSPRYKDDMELRIGAFLVLTYVLTLLLAWRVWPYVAASAGLFVAAFVCWWTDKRQTFPVVPWGHGAWHVLTAAATVVAFVATYRAAL